MTNISKRAYAAHRKVSESVIRRHVKEGTLAEAIDRDGKIDAAKADAILDAATKQGPRIAAPLVAARDRKARASLSLLRGKVKKLEGQFIPCDPAAMTVRGVSLRIAARIRSTIKAAAGLAPGMDAAVAHEQLTHIVRSLLADLSTASIEYAGPSAEEAAAIPAKTAVDLAAEKADLQARVLEIEADVASGALVSVEQTFAALGTRFATVRQKLLSIPSKYAPAIAAMQIEEARATLGDAAIDAVAELACEWVTAEELRAA